MKTILIALFFLFEIILVSSQEQQHPIKGQYKTVLINGNLDGWRICSYDLTNFASFSVRIGSDSPIDNFGSNLNYIGNRVTKYSGTSGEGVFVRLQSYDYEYSVPSLSCGILFEQVSYGCDRDILAKKISTPRQWCLLIINPFVNQQRIKVAVSFTESVFAMPFDSPGLVLNNGNGTDTNTVKDSISTISYQAKTKKRNLRRRFYKS